MRRDGHADGLSAPKKAGAVGFELRLAHGLAVGDAQMGGPDFRLARRPLAARRKNSAEIVHEFRFDEQFGESGVRDVGGLRPQRQFGIGSDFDVPLPASGVGDRDATHLGIVLGGDQHVHRRRKRAVAPRELRAVLVE